MPHDHRRLYRALSARDSRFDGIFFVGVTSTRVYCRPICPVKTPKAANCRFFASAHEAEHARFRPCLRCRPELAPHSVVWSIHDASYILAHQAARLLDEPEVWGDAPPSVEQLAAKLELSTRQIRRIVQKQLGVAPIQLLLTRRLLLAKQLLTETSWAMTEIAFASGFSSLRRFNDAFTKRYRMPPSGLRRGALAGPLASGQAETSALTLTYRPPFDWQGLLTFLAARALPGIEHVTDDSYARTVQIGGASGWIRVKPSSRKHALQVQFTHSLTPVLPALLDRVRALFDLDARPDVIAKHLGKDARLAEAVRARPGLRVPGAFNGFEMGLRAILGQQVTVKAATTIAGRFVEAFSDPFETPLPQLSRLTPSSRRVADLTATEIAGLGIVSARAASIVALARALESGSIHLDAGAQQDADVLMARLMELPGVGPWTANYIAMRALRWPDAFPKEDIAIRNNLGGVTPREAEALSQAWRPWRSYAVMHVWNTPRPAGDAR